MMYELPKTLEIGGKMWKIRSDFRAVLDIITALNDVDFSDDEKALASLVIFYVDFDNMPVTIYGEAIEKCFWFINGGKTNDEMDAQPHKLIDWEKDFHHICSPINKQIHGEIRAIMHAFTDRKHSV